MQTNKFRGGRINCSGARNCLFGTISFPLLIYQRNAWSWQFSMFDKICQFWKRKFWSRYGDKWTLLCHHYKKTCVCVYWNLRIVNCLRNRKKHCWHEELNRLKIMPMWEKTMHTCLSNNHFLPTRHAILKSFPLRHHWLYCNLTAMLIVTWDCRLCVERCLHKRNLSSSLLNLEVVTLQINCVMCEVDRFWYF